MTGASPNHISGVYTLHLPVHTGPVIVDSPHSGRIYPADFDYTCDFDDLRRAEDLLLDELLTHLPGLGVPVLCAEFPRSYIDVNRAANDIDDLLFDTPWPGPVDHNGRSSAGIGLVRRLLKPGVPVYGAPLAHTSVQQRLETYYHPYHAVLANVIAETHRAHGQVLHLNLHSMSARVFGDTPAQRLFAEKDVVIGDRNGTTCDPNLSQQVCRMFRDLGYRVGHNDPYRGAEIVKRHGRPNDGTNSMQIEFNKTLYVFEKSLALKPAAVKLRRDIEAVVTQLQALLGRSFQQLAAD